MPGILVLAASTEILFGRIELLSGKAAAPAHREGSIILGFWHSRASLGAYVGLWRVLEASES